MTASFRLWSVHVDDGSASANLQFLIDSTPLVVAAQEFVFKVCPTS